MTTFLTILAAAAVAAPLVVLALRGTRADPYRHGGWRPTRDALGWPVVAAPQDLDAIRAERDLAAVRAHRPDADAGERRAVATRDGDPVAEPGRAARYGGAPSRTNPNPA